MQNSTSLSRRRLLGTLGAAGTAGLAGCAGGFPGGGEDDEPAGPPIAYARIQDDWSIRFAIGRKPGVGRTLTALDVSGQIPEGIRLDSDLDSLNWTDIDAQLAALEEFASSDNADELSDATVRGIRSRIESQSAGPIPEGHWERFITGTYALPEEGLPEYDTYSAAVRATGSATRFTFYFPGITVDETVDKLGLSDGASRAFEEYTCFVKFPDGFTYRIPPSYDWPTDSYTQFRTDVGPESNPSVTLYPEEPPNTADTHDDIEESGRTLEFPSPVSSTRLVFPPIAHELSPVLGVLQHQAHVRQLIFHSTVGSLMERVDQQTDVQSYTAESTREMLMIGLGPAGAGEPTDVMIETAAYSVALLAGATAGPAGLALVQGLKMVVDVARYGSDAVNFEPKAKIPAQIDYFTHGLKPLLYDPLDDEHRHPQFADATYGDWKDTVNLAIFQSEIATASLASRHDGVRVSETIENYRHLLKELDKRLEHYVRAMNGIADIFDGNDSDTVDQETVDAVYGVAEHLSDLSGSVDSSLKLVDRYETIVGAHSDEAA